MHNSCIQCIVQFLDDGVDWCGQRGALSPPQRAGCSASNGGSRCRRSILLPGGCGC